MFCTPALLVMVPCSFPVTFMYGEWVLGVMVKAQLISRTASDFRRRDLQEGCCYKKKNGGKRLLGLNSKLNLVETGEIDVKKREESE